MGFIELEPAQFVELQDEWEQSGFPRDLYYPAAAQRVAVDPVPQANYRGAIIRQAVTYSPRRWLLREELLASWRVPTEAERAATFEQDVRAFNFAITRRMKELMEPGRECIGAWRELHRVRMELLAGLQRVQARIDAADCGATQPE